MNRYHEPWIRCALCGCLRPERELRSGQTRGRTLFTCAERDTCSRLLVDSDSVAKPIPLVLPKK